MVLGGFKSFDHDPQGEHFTSQPGSYGHTDITVFHQAVLKSQHTGIFSSPP